MLLTSRKLKTEGQNQLSGEGIIETSFDIIERKGNTLNIHKEIVNHNINGVVDGSPCEVVSPERSKSRSQTVRTTKTLYSHSDLEKKKAQAYIYQNFGYDINEAGSFPSDGPQRAAEGEQVLGDTINTNRLNNSMQDMEDAFHRLNAFTDQDLKRKD